MLALTEWHSPAKDSVRLRGRCGKILVTALNVGTVTITNVTCGPDPTFTLTSGAQLGSEVSGPTIPMHGRITYPAPPQDPH